VGGALAAQHLDHGVHVGVGGVGVLQVAAGVALVGRAEAAARHAALDEERVQDGRVEGQRVEAGAGEFGVEDAEVEAGVVGHEDGAGAEEAAQPRADDGEGGLVAHHLVRDAVDGRRGGRDGAAGVHELRPRRAGDEAAVQLLGAELDDAVAAGAEGAGLGIDRDDVHGWFSRARNGFSRLGRSAKVKRNRPDPP
jgi:hypothetical protein